MLWDEMTDKQKRACYESYLKDFKAMYKDGRDALTFEEYAEIYKGAYHPYSELEKACEA